MSSCPSNVRNVTCMVISPEAAHPTSRPRRERRTDGTKPSAINLRRREDLAAKDPINHLFNIFLHLQKIGMIPSARNKRKFRRQRPKRRQNPQRRLKIKTQTQGTPSASIKDTNAENFKGKNDEDNEEEQNTDDSEEEGEIGESQASLRRSTRGCKTDKEKREEETYKEKLQGSQPTLEKLLASKPRMPKSQPQGSKGAH